MVGLALWDLSHNAPLLTALLCAALAQLLKVGAHWQATREWEWGRLAGSGGMPSSHAALVHGLASAIGTQRGFDSDGFAGETAASSPLAPPSCPPIRAALNPTPRCWRWPDACCSGRCPVAAIFALVVSYDACGVRFQADRHGELCPTSAPHWAG